MLPRIGWSAGLIENRIIGKGGVQQRRPALDAQRPSGRTVCLIVAVPTLQDVKVERDGHKRVRLEIVKSERDGLVYPDKVLWVVGRSSDDRRPAEFAEEACPAIRRCRGGDRLRARFAELVYPLDVRRDRKSTRLNSSHSGESRMPSSA